jgi:hypothetical protein
MKHLLSVMLVALVLAGSVASIAAAADDRPAGVAAADWIPINERVGIVLVHANNQPVAPGQALLLKPTVAGYYMLKGAAGWSRLVIVEPMKGPADAG